MKSASDLPSLRFPFWLILGGLAALILFQQLVQLPGGSMMVLALNNAAHTPFFTVLTLLLWQLHPLAPPGCGHRRKLMMLFAAMIFLATATELAQTWTRRDASVEDWLRNVLGIGAGFCFILLWQFRGRAGGARQLALGLLGLVLLASGFRGVFGVMEQHQQRLDALPHLLVMDDDYLRRVTRRFDRWQLGKQQEFYAQANRRVPSGAGRNALLLLLDRGNYPGLTLREPYPDWRQYQWLILEAESLDDTPIGMTLRVETWRDRGMDNAYEFFLPPAPTTVHVPLEMLVRGSAEERIDIRNLLLFVDGRQDGKGVLLYDLRLE